MKSSQTSPPLATPRLDQPVTANWLQCCQAGLLRRHDASESKFLFRLTRNEMAFPVLKCFSFSREKINLKQIFLKIIVKCRYDVMLGRLSGESFCSIFKVSSRRSFRDSGVSKPMESQRQRSFEVNRVSKSTKFQIGQVETVEVKVATLSNGDVVKQSEDHKKATSLLSSRALSGSVGHLAAYHLSLTDGCSHYPRDKRKSL